MMNDVWNLEYVPIWQLVEVESLVHAHTFRSTQTIPPTHDGEQVALHYTNQSIKS